ncbi:MAG: energy transducer TonB [Vulcanimicrobiaceae bacterium]
METRRARRILLAAFIFSLLAHAIVALIMRGPLGPPPQEAQVVTLQRRARIVSVLHRLPTPPPPRSTPMPKRAAMPKTVARSSKAYPSNARAVSQSRPAPASAAPEPTPSATPSRVACRDADLPASVVGTPPPADIPPSVRAQATSGIVRVRVQLDRYGSVTGTSVTQTSGNPSLDLVAEAMAGAAQYAPAYIRCKAVASTYAFSVKFAAW